MFSPNFQYLIYKQQEREYLQEAEHMSMIREAEKGSGAAHSQYPQIIERLAEKIAGLARSISHAKTYGAGACCTAN